MARAAIFLDNLLEPFKALVSSGDQADLPKENVFTDLPGQMYEQHEGQEGGGSWEVTSSTNKIYRHEGILPYATITIPTGWYTNATLATAVKTALEASSSRTYNLTYNASARKWALSSSGSFSLGNSTTTDNLLTTLLGWDAINTGVAALHTANDSRSSTQTWLRVATGTAIAPDLFAVILDSVGGTDTSLSTLYGSVKVYGHSTNLGNVAADWAAGASLALNVSDRTTTTENTLQVATTTSTTAYSNWFLVWDHVDDHAHHRIGIFRGLKSVSSSTRTVREVQDQDLLVSTSPLTLANQHPVELLSEWRMTIELERWEAADYRAFMVAAKRYGTHRGIVFALRWTDVVSGALSAQDEVDVGFLFYGSIRALSSDAYSGNESDYMSGSMSLGQLRP